MKSSRIESSICREVTLKIKALFSEFRFRVVLLSKIEWLADSVVPIATSLIVLVASVVFCKWKRSRDQSLRMGNETSSQSPSEKQGTKHEKSGSSVSSMFSSIKHYFTGSSNTNGNGPQSYSQQSGPRAIFVKLSKPNYYFANQV